MFWLGVLAAAALLAFLLQDVIYPNEGLLNNLVNMVAGAVKAPGRCPPTSV